jgi:SAM-dependent methyltransferase
MLIIAENIKKKISYIKSKQISKIINCEICNSKNFKTIQNLARINKVGQYGYLNVVICLNCSHKFINPRFIDDFYIKYYLKKYRKVAFGFLEPTKTYLNWQKKRGLGVYNFYKSSLPRTGKVLDHGCASGGTMIPWIENGWDAYGFDPHTPSVKFGKKMLGLNIKNCFGENINYKKNQFDVVMSLGSLEHSYNVNKSIKEIYRVLKHNGKLIIRWRSNEIIGSSLEYFNHNHYRYFTRNTWKLLLKKHHFKVKSFTNQKLEKSNAYEYIVALKNINKIKSLKLTKKYIQKEINYLKKKNINYLSLCKKARKEGIFFTKSLNKKKVFLKKQKKILLNNFINSSVNRFVFELKKFYELIMNKNVQFR